MTTRKTTRKPYTVVALYDPPSGDHSTDRFACHVTADDPKHAEAEAQKEAKRLNDYDPDDGDMLTVAGVLEGHLHLVDEG